MAELDHLVVCAKTLAEGIEYVEGALGVKMHGGGVHTGLGTHNTLLSLGDHAYLEVISPNPEDPHPKTAKMFDLDNFSGNPRLTNWVMRTNSVSGAVTHAPSGIGEIQALSRGSLNWLMTKPAKGKLPFDGAFPALIEWQCPHPAPLLKATDCQLHRLSIAHPASEDLSTALAPHLEDPRIAVLKAPTFSMRAEIKTPAGVRILE